MSNKIQIKRGLKANLPILDSGEPGFTTDTKEFFIGDGSKNIEFAKQADLEINNTKLLDMIYQKAGGTATVVTVPMQTLVNGYSKTFVASASNGGADTTVNGKKLYKPGTIKSPNLIVGKAYTVWYDLASDCFFIKASAEGDADVSHVLAPKKFSNDSDTGLTGMMPDNGAVNQLLAINGTYTIPSGYHNGSGKVTQSIATKAEATITPSTVNKIISANQYLTGDQTILGDSDLIESNIVSTANIFGIQGTANIQSLGGTNFASGPLPGSITLSFTPKVVILKSSSDGRLIILLSNNFGMGTPIGIWDIYNIGSGTGSANSAMFYNFINRQPSGINGGYILGNTIYGRGSFWAFG